MSFKKKFNEEFEKLNPAQREAAETVEGPVLIVAGPGTGKTQTLALRLANILQKTQAKPHNLLALTFTESAAIELKKRLAEIIGPDAYGIQASTFHSFCARLHATFPAEFATTRERVQIDELQQSQLFREILTAGEFPLLKPLRAPELYLYDLSRALSDLKREGVAPEKLREIIEAEEKELVQEERINPKTKKPFGKILQAEKRLAKNLELAEFYAQYQELLNERGFTDYDDLILSVVNKLTPQISGGLTEKVAGGLIKKEKGGEPEGEDSFLLAYLQENFLYATVDEFQDTNGAQNAILTAWVGGDPKPNLCVVGDDDQSIFRFQGASLANILEFHENFPEAQIVTLTENYRSTQKLLDAAMSLIGKNEERLVNKIEGLSKDLTTPGVARNPRGCIVAEASNEADEITFVTTQIQKLLKAKVTPEEIAVLYRNRVHGDMLTGALSRKQVPFFRADGQNALRNARVQQLVKLLRIVENPKDALSSLATFFADFTGIPAVEVYRISREVSFAESFLDIALKSKQKAVKALAEKLLNFQKMKAEQNLLELVENIAAGSGLTQVIAKNEEFEAAEALTAFLTFVRTFATTREVPTLENLLADIAVMEKLNIRLAVPARLHAAITLTTAHSAKGLEWENVFILHADDNSWGGRAKPEKLKLPELVPGTSESEKDKRLEDERRLFYVAMTRAKQGLTISVANSYESREMTPSRFIAEIDPKLIEKVSAPAAGLAALPLEGDQKLDPDSQKFLKSLLKDFRLSPTALNNYLCCPQKFLFQNLLRLPTALSVDDRLGAIFGSAVHTGFEEFFREFKQTGKLPEIELAIKGLKKSLDREPLTKTQRSDIERDAVPAIEKYIADHTAKLQPPVEIEYNFGKHDVHLDDIPLTGKVDRIDFIPQTKTDVIFVDYKAMKPLTRAQIQGETANSTGDPYRQLLFYLLLAELDNRFIFKPREVVLSFVRADDKGDFHDEAFSPPREEIEELKKLIKETFGKIQKLEFACPEDADCKRCDFREVCGK
ncbi:MAG: ATP-dependent DNA helicase [Patescibacteria group bacterium]